MDKIRLELENAIEFAQLQASYLVDWEHYDLFERKFRDLTRGQFGRITNDDDAEQFKIIVLNNFRGAEQTYQNFYHMLVGDSRTGQKSIFEIQPAFCSFKGYLFYMMKRLFMFETMGKAMAGGSINPSQTIRFTKLFVGIEQKHTSKKQVTWVT